MLPLEDHISRAVRRHLPDVQEKVGSLPDRLRLLGLPGEERSRTILANATELLKGDASGAAAFLGATECQIPEDTRWARAAVDALDNGAEAEIQQARALQHSLVELDMLCPGKGQGLLPEDEQATFEESLSSESFFERLAGPSSGAPRRPRANHEPLRGGERAVSGGPAGNPGHTRSASRLGPAAGRGPGGDRGETPPDSGSRSTKTTRSDPSRRCWFAAPQWPALSRNCGRKSRGEC